MSTFHSFSRFLVLGLVALATASVGASSAQASWTKIIETGHVDINGFQDGDDLKINLRLSATEIYDPATTLFLIEDSVTRPDDSTWDFLGVAGGEQIWVSPTNVDTGLFGGVDVPEMGLRNSARDLFPTGSPMTFEFDMTTFSGPGDFSVFLDDGRLFMSSAGLSTENDNKINVTSHSHYNWGFSKAGLYTLRFRVLGGNSGLDDGPWTTINVRAGVIPEPSSIVLVGLGAAVLGGVSLRRRLRRQPVEQA